MFYAVQWLRGETVIGRTAFDGLLEAKAFAKGHFATQKIRKGATAAQVTDADGVVYFRFGEGAD